MIQRLPQLPRLFLVADKGPHFRVFSIITDTYAALLYGGGGAAFPSGPPSGNRGAYPERCGWSGVPGHRERNV